MRTKLALMALATLASCSELADHPHPVAFKLVNAGPCVAYVQVSGGRHLALSKDGRAVQIEHRCEVCDCSQCPKCWVCGLEGATVARIAPGESYLGEWDGRVWGPGFGTCSQSCESASAAGPGDYLAEVAYGPLTEEASWGAGPIVAGAVTTRRSFQHPESGEVQIPLDTSAFQGLPGSECPGLL